MKIDKNGYSKCELCGASRPTAKMQAAETCSGCGAVSSMICRGGCVEQPVAHEHSPVLVELDDEHQIVSLRATSGTEPLPSLSQAATRAIVLVYREKVLEAFRAWDMRPGDTRTWHQVVMGVDLP